MAESHLSSDFLDNVCRQMKASLNLHESLKEQQTQNAQNGVALPMAVWDSLIQTHTSMLKHYRTMLQGMVAQSRQRHGESGHDTKDLETMLRHADDMLEGTKLARDALCGRHAHVNGENEETESVAAHSTDKKDTAAGSSKRKAGSPPQAEPEENTDTSNPTDAQPISTNEVAAERPSPFKRAVTYPLRSSPSPPKLFASDDSDSSTSRTKRRKHTNNRSVATANSIPATTTSASIPLPTPAIQPTRALGDAAAATGSSNVSHQAMNTSATKDQEQEQLTSSHELPSVADEITNYPEPEFYDLNAELAEKDKANEWIRKRERGEIEKRKRESLESLEGVSLRGLAGEKVGTAENETSTLLKKSQGTKKRKINHSREDSTSPGPAASPSCSPPAAGQPQPQEPPSTTTSARPAKANANLAQKGLDETIQKATPAELAAMAQASAHKNTVPDESQALKGAVRTKRTFSDRLSGIQGNKFSSKKVRLTGKSKGEPVAGIVGRGGGSSP